MAKNEWAIPIVLGLVAVAAAAVFLPAHHASTETPVSTPQSDAAKAWVAAVPVLPAPDMPAGRVTLLHIASHVVDVVPGTYGDGAFTPTSPCPSSTNVEFCWQSGASIPLYSHAVSRGAGGPRFGVDGYDVVRVHAFIFTSEGRLKFHNDPANATRWELAADPAVFPSAPWYVGNGSAPAGTLVLPPQAKALFAPLRSGLVGLPVGAVTSARLDSPTIELLYGAPLYATARIEGLQRAP
ncbi:MAG: hypothetical protein V4510_11195 [bacterium]